MRDCAERSAKGNRKTFRSTECSKSHCAVEGLLISLIVRYLSVDDIRFSMHYFTTLSMRKSYLCTSAKKDALLSWYGFSNKLSVPDLWSSNISVCDRLFGSRAKRCFWRRLSHIKLVYQSGIPLEAKGYLGFGRSWVKHNTLLKQEQQKNEKDELSFEKSAPRNRNLFS